MRAPILVFTGPPGAGKTTVADIVARSSPRSVHLVADQCFTWVASGFIAPWLPEAARQNETVIEVVAVAAARYADNGYNVVVDGIIGPWYLERFRDAAGPVARRMDYVVLRPKRQVALSRATNRRGEVHLVDPAPVEAMVDAFAQLGALETHVVDSSSLSPEETATVVLDGATAGRFALDDGRTQ